MFALESVNHESDPRLAATTTLCAVKVQSPWTICLLDSTILQYGGTV